MANFKVESNSLTLNAESENVILGKENIETQYKLYTEANDTLKSKWKGNSAVLYQRYCVYMQNAVDIAITTSQTFGDNIQTFSQKSKEIDDNASINAEGEKIYEARIGRKI